MGSRFAARLLDGLIVGLPIGALFAAVAAGSGSDVQTVTEPGSASVSIGFSGTTSLLLYLVIGIVYTLYEGLLTSTVGATPGKKALGIRVALFANGQHPPMGESFKRACTLILPYVVPFLGALWFLICGISGTFGDQFKRGWHDKAGQTLVVGK